MDKLSFVFGATKQVKGRAHVGIVGSGDLELIVESSPDNHQAYVKVNTSVVGHSNLWNAILTRFFQAHPYSVAIEINDFGATPGVVHLRLAQAMEVLQDAQ